MANIYMTRENSDPVPQYPLPAGFEIRPLPADGMGIWQRVMLDTGFTHQDVEGAFERDFARHAYGRSRTAASSGSPCATGD
jgi:hypothetical protein